MCDIENFIYFTEKRLIDETRTTTGKYAVYFPFAFK